MFKTLTSSLMRLIVYTLAFLIVVSAFVFVWGGYIKAIMYLLSMFGVNVSEQSLGQLLLIALFGLGLTAVTSIFAKKQANRIISKYSL